jgi:hypothetical protein
MLSTCLPTLSVKSIDRWHLNVEHVWQKSQKLTKDITKTEEFEHTSGILYVDATENDFLILKPLSQKIVE